MENNFAVYPQKKKKKKKKKKKQTKKKKKPNKQTNIPTPKLHLLHLVNMSLINKPVILRLCPIRT